MTYVLVRDGVVIHCVSVNDLQSTHDCYPDCQIIEQTGAETVGWLYDGTAFAPA